MIPQAQRLAPGAALAFALLASATWSAGACAAAGSSPEAVRGAASLLAASDPARLMSAVALAVLVGLLVLVVFLVASFAIIRSVRSAGDEARRRRAAPTPSDDVWSKHKLPDDWDEDDDDDQLPVY